MGKERYGSDDRVDGRETVRNSMGRGPWGRSYGRVDGGETMGNRLGSSGEKERYGSEDRVDGKGKPWEMAWGELRWQGARWSDDKVNGNRGK